MADSPTALIDTAEEIETCSHGGGGVKILPGKNHRVLVVDDSAITRKMVGAILRQMGCEVVEAEDGEEGLLLVQKGGFDLIVLDIQMPVMDGVEMLAQLRKDSRFYDQMVVMLTGETEREVVKGAIITGIQGYIRKGLSIGQLRARLKTFLT